MTAATGLGTTVLELFETTAKRAPQAPAVTFEDRTLTYAELDARAARLAGALAVRGVPAGARVAVTLERSADLIAALLGVWKAGAVYVPVDPSYPAGRIAHLLEDSAAAAVIDAGFLADLPTATAATTAPAARPGPRDCAYVIYTSGSTGLPKGVEVEHRSLANVIRALTDAMTVREQDAWLSMAPASFDIAMAEFCLPLTAGARLVLSSQADLLDAARILKLITRHSVSRMQAVPTQWQALVDAGLAAPELFGMSGGEALPIRLAGELTARLGGLINGYGPTETTVLSTYWPVPANPTSIAIGRPIANTDVYVLDDDMRECAEGELYIGGAGVARGYLGRPDLTQERFRADPHRPGGRMYRTGDLVRRAADGTLAFLGRVDGQTKIRGQRIELGEVENCLGTHPEVGGAVAVVREKKLVAYVVARPGGASLSDRAIREYAAARLPSAMVPSSVVVLARFPITPNGKIDRAALDPARPEDAAGSGAGNADAVRPRPDGFAARVLALIAEILDLPSVSAGEDLFDLGGDSLTVMRIAARIKEKHGIEVSAELFYDTDTVGELVEQIGLLRVGDAR
jgi:amino acid adenylation domain-containing protein